MPTATIRVARQPDGVPDDGTATARISRPACPGSPHPSVAFALLGAVQFTAILAITIISLALPVIQRELGLGQADLVLLTTAYGLAFGGLLLLGGRLADLYGRRRVLTVGLAIFGLASTAAGFAPNFAVLLVARFGQGVGAALAAPAALAPVAMIFPDPGRRARALAIWGGLGSIGATAGTLLSGVIAGWTSWRWAFAIPALVAIVGVLLARRLVPPGPASSGGRLDLLGAALATAGLTAVSYGVGAAADTGWGSARTLLPAVVGAALLAAFILVERRSEAPLLPLSYVRSRQRAAALLAVLLTATGYGTSLLLLTLYFQQARGLSPLLTSAAFAPFGLTGVVVGSLSGQLIGRFGLRAVAVIGLLIAGFGLLVLGQLDGQTPYVGPLLTGLVLFPLGAGLAFAGATVAAVEGVPEEQAGLAAGVVNTAIEIGPTVMLAMLVSIAGTRAARLVEHGVDPTTATVTGYGLALHLAGLALIAAAALIAVTFARAPATTE